VGSSHAGPALADEPPLALVIVAFLAALGVQRLVAQGAGHLLPGDFAALDTLERLRSGALALPPHPLLLLARRRCQPLLLLELLLVGDPANEPRLPKVVQVLSEGVQVLAADPGPEQVYLPEAHD